MGQKAKFFGLAPTEKSPCWVRLVARGAPGHASVPHANNAVVRLVKALGRIEAREHRVRTHSAVDAMFRTLRARGFVPTSSTGKTRAPSEMLSSVDAHLGAITRDTVNLTGLRAGQKHNVIPATAEATLDCRLLPGTEPSAFVEELRQLIDDPSIEIERVLVHDSGESSLDSPVVKIISEVIAERYGDEASCCRCYALRSTDSHAYRAAGASAYGFTPALLTREELASVHGHNERISADNLLLGTQILFDVVTRLARC
jgi:acetylornithine deacetylase/succinyl-diaminopimelate desuccinylase-like protein